MPRLWLFNYYVLWVQGRWKPDPPSWQLPGECLRSARSLVVLTGCSRLSGRTGLGFLLELHAPRSPWAFLSWDQIRGCLRSPETEAHISAPLLPSSPPQALVLSCLPPPLFSPSALQPDFPGAIYAYFPDLNSAQHLFVYLLMSVY